MHTCLRSVDCVLVKIPPCDIYDMRSYLSVSPSSIVKGIKPTAVGTSSRHENATEIKAAIQALRSNFCLYCISIRSLKALFQADDSYYI